MNFEERQKAKIKKRQELEKKKKGKFRESTSKKRKLTTGIYELDKKTYGGIHAGKINEVFAGESAGKTLLSYTIGKELNKYNYETGKLDLSYSNPQSVCLLDMEDCADETWERKIGFHRDKYGNHVDYICGGDVACDVVKDFISDDLYQLIIVDSTDCFYPLAVLEGEYEMNDMGLKARALARCMRKWSAALAEAGRRHKETPWRVPTVLLLSHAKPIFMDQFGRWESESGKTVRFYSSLRMYLSQNKINKEGTAEYGVGKMTATVKKNKMNPAGTVANYVIGLADTDKQAAGQVDNVKNIFTDAMDFDIIVREKKGVSLYGEQYSKQQDLKDRLNTDPELLTKLWKNCVDFIEGNKVEMEIVEHETENFENTELVFEEKDE